MVDTRFANIKLFCFNVYIFLEISLIQGFLNAAKHSDVTEVLQMLDAAISVDIGSEIGFTALMQAARSNDIDVTRLLLQKGADVNKQNDVGWTALHWAAYSTQLMPSECYCSTVLQRTSKIISVTHHSIAHVRRIKRKRYVC